MPLAVVFNNFLRTSGGGERSSLDFAAAFCDLGYDVIVATDHQIQTTLEQACAPFGIELGDKCTLREFNGLGELQHFIQTGGCDVFLNHTFCSFIRNYAPIGLYTVMFAGPIGPSEVANLITYDRILSISDFTQQYVEVNWSEELPAQVLCPPISRTHLENASTSFVEKERLILNVGRFNVFGHNKHQLEAIKSFTRNVDSGVFSNEWRLRVIGQVNDNPETHEYIEACKAAAQEYQVEILLNAPLPVLQDSYRRASYLFQFTGLGLDFGQTPEHCEHLGLVALDGFAYGLLPIAYQRGGAAMIIRHAIDGFVFQNEEEIDLICKQIAESFGNEWHQHCFNAARTRVKEFAYPAFRDGLASLLEQLQMKMVGN